MKEFTHFNEKGRARMVDVSEKQATKRIAVAKGLITMKEETVSHIKENKIKKGDVLSVAQVSSIMAVKKCSDLIPMCHPLKITSVETDFIYGESSIEVFVEVGAMDSTGVEMEALTGVTVALLTIYDMCKSYDKEMEIGKVFLLEKKGGKSGYYKKILREAVG